MKKITTVIICSVLTTGLSLPVSAEVKCLPSQALKSLVAGKSFDGKISGYGWGEEDDPSSLSLDFTVLEPILFDADEIESLEAGDEIIIGYEVYTVDTAKAEGSNFVVTPKEEWLTPITFKADGDDIYGAENAEGTIKIDSFSFPGKLAADLVYINKEGNSLSAAELLKDLSEEAVDTFSDFPKITFDEDAYIVELNFSE